MHFIVATVLWEASCCVGLGPWDFESAGRYMVLQKKLCSIYKCLFFSPSSSRLCFSSGHVWMWMSDCEESWVPQNWCFWTVVLEKTLESPLDCKEIQPVHFKGDQSWVFFGRTDAKAETPILWPHHAELTHWRLWCWEGLGAGGKGDDRGWDGWMASRTRWTWVWVNSRSWWWTGRPGILQFMGSQRVGHDWVTELNWIYRCMFTGEEGNRGWNKTKMQSCSLLVSICITCTYLQETHTELLCLCWSKSAPNNILFSIYSHAVSLLYLKTPYDYFSNGCTFSSLWLHHTYLNAHY